MNYVYLSDEELCFLDGKCSAKVQVDVDGAKARIAMQSALPNTKAHIAQFVADVVEAAKKRGVLICRHENLRSCDYCKKSAGYAKHTRYGKWHRKGDDNHDRPLTFSGKELVHAFITMQGHATLGCCNECWNEAQPLLAEALKNVEAEIPEAITGAKPRLKRYDNQKCSKCGWSGHEGQLGKLPAVMGGFYPGKCPQCGAENLPFGRIVIENAPGFTLVPASA